MTAKIDVIQNWKHLVKFLSFQHSDARIKKNMGFQMRRQPHVTECRLVSWREKVKLYVPKIMKWIIGVNDV